jgi:DNA adenine methylase
MGEQLTIFEKATVKKQQTQVVNVASVPQRSPFRYPGGKTWLIPTIREWLRQDNNKKSLIEPFADRILNFELSHENVNKELSNPNKEIKDVAFCTILKNRVFHGGIIAKGSGMLKNGENGKGIASRWYAKTLADRIRAINFVKHKIQFLHTDAFKVIERNSDNKNAYFFIDPPYTIAGKRLYSYFNIDHEQLFYLTSKIQGKFMLTYDDTEEIRELANKYHLAFRTTPMKTTHHLEKNEIIISDNFDWWTRTTGANSGLA